jgi:hypothetical protein
MHPEWAPHLAAELLLHCENVCQQRLLAHALQLLLSKQRHLISLWCTRSITLQQQQQHKVRDKNKATVMWHATAQHVLPGVAIRSMIKAVGAQYYYSHQRTAP